MKRSTNISVQGPAVAPAAGIGARAIPGTGPILRQQQRPRQGAFDRFPSGI